MVAQREQEIAGQATAASHHSFTCSDRAGELVAHSKRSRVPYGLAGGTFIGIWAVRE